MTSDELRWEPADLRVSWAVRASRLGYILRYYRPSQLIGRLASMSRRKWLGIRGARRYVLPNDSGIELRDDAGLTAWAFDRVVERGPASADRARRCLEGRFAFLNVERTLPDPIDWRLSDWPDAPHLWRFHLQYHEVLGDLAAEAARTGDPAFARRAWDVAGQWIAANPVTDPRGLSDAWHPYCISRRLPVWIGLWLVAPPPEGHRGRILTSLFAQARFLADHLEFDLGGNHLLENLRALTLASVFFRGRDGERWLRRGTRLLAAQLDEQILGHGEHFERSPMYHAQMLDAVLDIAEATAGIAPETAGRCHHTAMRMAGFLEAILHPDGGIPLLGDSAFESTLEPSRLIARASESALCGTPSQHIASVDGSAPIDLAADAASGMASSRRLGDYWIYRHRGDFLLFDAGPVCPDHLPAHGHADLLQIEASWGGRRLLVDSGVFNYQDDGMRRYCRSTAAHNVLQIDGREQCDIWSRFRMGYRGWPTELVHGQQHGFHWVRASHNAYRRAGVPLVERWLACRPEGPWLCIDRASGYGEHTLTAWLHVHPDVSATQRDEFSVELDLPGATLVLRYLAPGQVTLGSGWYCPEFGKRVAACVLRWSARVQLPAFCGWSLSWNHPPTLVSVDRTESNEPVIRWDSTGFPSQWLPFSA